MHLFDTAIMEKRHSFPHDALPISLSEEEFYSIEDSYVLHMDELAGDISSLLKHHGKITAILLIFQIGRAHV